MTTKICGACLGHGDTAHIINGICIGCGAATEEALGWIA